MDFIRIILMSYCVNMELLIKNDCLGCERFFMLGLLVVDRLLTVANPSQ